MTATEAGCQLVPSVEPLPDSEDTTLRITADLPDSASEALLQMLRCPTRDFFSFSLDRSYPAHGKPVGKEELADPQDKKPDEAFGAEERGQNRYHNI